MRWLPSDPLGRFIALSLMLLPLWFVAWFNLADLLLWPAITASGALLNLLHPGLVEGFEGRSGALDVLTGINVAHPRGLAQLIIEVNVLSYAWNLPVLFALLFATDPRFFSYRHLALAYLGLLPCYVWGLCFDVLKTLALQSGAEANAFLGYSDFQLELIGLGYQFGYLMLPVIGAVALWVSMNREMLLLLLDQIQPAPES
ncbi:exosortase H-associated membrane protein [Chromatocurvus halotolerans]|uniref:Uncharacterized protein n=1 Tax=Chromatocurvus halotolerans TaxID=1132028 RepID=A0A4R2KRV8_9GAMM|nr:exosortase H-associated membrane protein [Chromatocurvus halotolerans]TCO75512.1 hypothetical protein EV688_10878 [Chromatocurvus halotolerans]